MKKLVLAGVALCGAVAFGGNLQIVAPGAGETVSLLTAAQKEFVTMSPEARRARFVDAEFRQKTVKLLDKLPGDQHRRQAFWPQPVRLAWTATDGVSYSVRVTDAKKSEVVYDGTVKGGQAYVDNLEIAATYTWTVEGAGERAEGTFKTEDRAPRFIRYPGVPNVRDLGGRIGLDGRRVKQGMVIRSAGLNENATSDYYSIDELKAAGRYDHEKRKVARAKARLAQLEAWQKEPATMDREDAEYKEWCTRHPNEPVTAFLSSRIKRTRDKYTEDGEPHVFKAWKPGVSRVAGENGEYIRKRFGIRTDIDLRSGSECNGMTGSPLGESVTWLNHSSYAYAGLQVKEGKAAFAKVFKVFLDEKNYPIDFHCIAGQDRTGSVAFVLNALLGVAEDELYLDWEVTCFWNRHVEFCHEKRFDKLVEGFRKNYPAPTLRESCEKYVRDLGFTDADIAKLRSILLES